MEWCSGLLCCDCVSEHARYVGSIPCECINYFLYNSMIRSDYRRMAQTLNIVEVDFSLRAVSPGTRHRACLRRHAPPACVPPSAAADGPAAHAFNCANLSASVPAANPSPSAVLTLAFSRLAVASLVCAFALLFAAG